MSVALPWVLALGVVSAAVVGVLHLLSVRRPPTLLLPTARFVPDRTVRAVSRTRQPSDVLLLVLRVLALLCAAVAVAGVRCASGSATVGHVIVTDAGVAMDTTALRRLVVGDDVGAAVAFASRPVDAAPRPQATGASAALFPLAWRATATLLDAEGQLDSVMLHVVSTDAPALDDAGWRTWRATWPGRVVLHSRGNLASARVRPTVRVVRPIADVRARANDVVVSGFRAAGIAVELVDANDARATDSVATVLWPRDGVPAGWRALTIADSSTTTSRALVVGGLALPSAWRVSARANDADSARALAWWSDGRVAAVERRVGATCRREVAVRVDESSDALLTPTAAAFLAQLAAPCLSQSNASVAAFTRVTIDSGTRETAPAHASATVNALRARLGGANTRPTDWWTPLLLALALLLVLLEWWARSRTSSTADAATS
jgi:hypothetical protein